MLLHLKNGDDFDIGFLEEEISYFSGNEKYVNISFKNHNFFSFKLNISVEDFKNFLCEQLKQTEEYVFQNYFVETKSDNELFYIRKNEILYFSLYERNNKKELFIKLKNTNIISNDDVQQFYLKML